MSGDDGRDRPLSGAVSPAPADLFENFSETERELVEGLAPVGSKVMPRGGSRAGRPNKRTVKMRELYLKMGFPHPLLWMGAMLRLSVGEAAVAFNCDLVDAAEILRKIAADALPYLESKRPVEIEAKGGDGTPVLVVGNVESMIIQSRVRRVTGQPMAIDDDVIEAVANHVRNQGVGEAPGDKSDGEASDDEG